MRVQARVLTVFLLASIGLGPAGDVHAAVSSRRGALEPGELAGRRLIVKYRDSVLYSVQCRLERGQGLATAVSSGGAALEALHERYGVRAARALFRSAEEERQSFAGQGCPPVEALTAHHRQKTAAALANFESRSSRIRPVPDPPELHHVYLLELAAGSEPMVAAASFSRSPHVEYAHPDYLVAIDLEPNDPFYRSSGSWGQPYDDLWGLKRDQLDLEPAWDLTRGEGVVVAVVDTGVDYRHPDLAANIWTNPGETAGNGIDDDRNGFVDDVRGWDFTTCADFEGERCRRPKPPDDDPRDDNLHGTHVAGTIAAVGDNGRGIIGVAPKAKIMAVKGLNADGRGVVSDLAAAIVYAAANGADVINNSWGCGFCPSVPLHEDAVRMADGLGAVVVFAAGNTARDSRGRSPHGLRSPKPIVVAASDPRDLPTFFTNFGATVDVTAPGGSAEWGGEPNILSLRKGGRCKGCRRSSHGRLYMRLQGTSMATPHASGVAALVIAHRPSLSADQVRQALRASSDDVGAPGFDLHSGAGRLNAARALGIASPLEVEIKSPAHLSAPRRGRLTFRGTAAGTGFDRYDLFVSPEDDIDWVPVGGGQGPIRNGVLGAVGRSRLGPGWNLVRLAATTRDGRRYEDVISIANQRSRPRPIGEQLEGLALAADISGDRIVWVQLDEPIRDQTGHVYLYDLERRSLLRLTEEPVRKAAPRISGRRVVWSDGGGPDGSRMFTCVLDAAARGCPVESIGSGSRPKVSGDRVVFGSPDGVVVLDLATQTRRQLPATAHNVEIDGDLVAFSNRPDGANGEAVYLFDWTTGQTRRLTDGDYNMLDLDFSGRTIVYLALERLAGPVLRAYDLESDTERVLREGFAITESLDLSGDRLVWAEAAEVKVLDVPSGRQSGVVVHPLALRSWPAISGRSVVWLDTLEFELEAGRLFYAKVRD